ncbi:MAG: sigma-70 family RNA polymerase sigma factor [Saonia sp.]
MDTDVLISGCIKKKPEAREALYKLYRNKLFSVCLKYCRSYSEAEDHLHDIFIEIFEKIKTYKGKGSFEGWMKRITINKAIDRYKRETNFELSDYKMAGLSEEIYLDEDNLPLSFETLMTLIQKLPTQYRIIFNLYELDDYPHKEIAKMLSISISTSKSNLHRAKIILKKQITELMAERKHKNVGDGK